MALFEAVFSFRLHWVFPNMFSIYSNYSKFYISLLELPSVVVQCVGGAVVVSHFSKSTLTSVLDSSVGRAEDYSLIMALFG